MVKTFDIFRKYYLILFTVQQVPAVTVIQNVLAKLFVIIKIINHNKGFGLDTVPGPYKASICYLRIDRQLIIISKQVMISLLESDMRTF